LPDAGAPIDTDALIVGAGPTALFLAFELGLQEISSHLVDSLPDVGGQCIALYADKPIYDIPAVPVCTGRELVERLMAQAAPMRPTFHLAQQVIGFDALADGSFAVQTSAGRRWRARTVFVAAGVGAFMPRLLQVDGVADRAGRQIVHSGESMPPVAGRQVVVLGDGDEALECALAMRAVAASVTLVHRREAFHAAPQTVALLHAAIAAGEVRFIAGQVVGLMSAEGVLTHLHIATPDGGTVAVAADQVAVCWGLSPKLGPIAGWGLALQRKQVVVDPATFETNVPGVYAVGDINTYPGKKKLIVCGFHEATLAAFAAAARLHPDRPAHLEYTTTSTRLHRLLGVADAG
jgi:thioredoxin reductase (NADPH)